MKRITISTLSLVAVAALLVAMTGIATAAMTSTSSKDAGKLTAEITMLNADVNLPQGEKIISEQLTDTFRISSSKLSSLTGRNLQYGDIAAILAFAEKMPGGVTDANINRVVSTRGSATGWDQVARNLSVSISDVASRLSSLEDTTHRNIKQAYADSLAAGAAGGGLSEPSEDLSGGAAGGMDSEIYGDEPGELGTGPSGEIEGEGSGGTDSDVYGEGAGGTDSESSSEMNEEPSQVPGGSGY